MPSQPRNNEIDISQNSAIEADLQSIISAIAALATQATIDEINAKLPALLGGNIPVNVQSSSAISGTVSVDNFPASQTVDGTVTANTGLTQPLTDTELRASAVNVSGTVTANTGLSQPLTDTELRASAVPVDTGLNPLTDAELRASAVPVSGSLTANLGTLNGAATSANQTTANSSLGSIDTKTPSLGQATMAVSQPVVVASNQSKYPIWLSYQPIKKTPARRTGTTISTSSGLYLPLIVIRLKTGATKLVYPDRLSFTGIQREHEVSLFIDDNTVITTGSFAAPSNVPAASTDIQRNIAVTATYTPSANSRCVFSEVSYRDTASNWSVAREMRVVEDSLLTTGKHLILAVRPIDGNGTAVGSSLTVSEF